MPASLVRLQATLQSNSASASQPNLHVHCRILDVSTLPLGDISNEEATEAERDAFAAWLLEQWRAKDALLGHFYSTGSFKGGLNVNEVVDVPLEMLHQQQDTIKLFAGMLPGLAMSWEFIKAVRKCVF